MTGLWDDGKEAMVDEVDSVDSVGEMNPVGEVRKVPPAGGLFIASSHHPSIFAYPQIFCSFAYASSHPAVFLGS